MHDSTYRYGRTRSCDGHEQNMNTYGNDCSFVRGDAHLMFSENFALLCGIIWRRTSVRTGVIAMCDERSASVSSFVAGHQRWGSEIEMRSSNFMFRRFPGPTIFEAAMDPIVNDTEVLGFSSGLRGLSDSLVRLAPVPGQGLVELSKACCGFR